ncbi:MAG: hydrogenase maturation protease [Gammaproteobacteria bacterium]
MAAAPDADPAGAADERPIAVIGVGSPCGDDQAGWLVVEALRRAAAAHDPHLAGVELKALDRPGPDLLNAMTGARAAIVIDAVLGASPGTVLRLSAGRLAAGSRPASTHAGGVADALALGACLGVLPPRLVLLGVGGERFAPGTGPGAAVRDGAVQAARAVLDELRALGAGSAR